MKITLIHGEDTNSARQRTIKITDAIKQRGWEIVNIDSSKTLGEQLRSDSLFGEQILFVYENVEKISAKDLDWLNKNSENYDSNLLLYYKNLASKTFTSKLPKSTKIESFDVPQELFKMLELMYPGNSKIFFTTFKRVLKSQPVELVFAMLARQVKDMYWCLVDEGSTGMPSWRVGKIKNQANRFGIERLASLINKLADIDVKTKTSNFVLVKNLE
jgi:DNA polymerase III delta subunit